MVNNNQGNDSTEGQNGQLNGEDRAPQVALITQYIRDLSFENPKAPESFQLQIQPQIEIAVNVNARQVQQDVNDQGDIYEVSLQLQTKANDKDDVLFVVELIYCGLFGMRNLNEESLEPFLLIEAPRLIFPFARRVIADVTRDGGFPPLLLDPIDFAGLYTARDNQPAPEEDMENKPLA